MKDTANYWHSIWCGGCTHDKTSKWYEISEQEYLQIRGI